MNTPFHHPFQFFARAKWCFTTRRVQREDAKSLSSTLSQAIPGDLVLARVQTIGSHKRVQLAEGRRSGLFPGDLVVLACGARYASDQFEGIAVLEPRSADMLAGGGVIGQMRSRHSAMKPPTRLEPLGLICREMGQVMNLADYALPTEVHDTGALPAIGVLGASMNAGKTTATAALIHGLTAAGLRVAGLKATGTGSSGDVHAYEDAGAAWVADFTDTGMASTYGAPQDRITAGLSCLFGHAEQQGCDIAVVEFADGVLQQETAALIGCPTLQARFAGWVYAAGDPLAALGGVTAMERHGLRPLALTGMLSASPLLAAETQAVTRITPTTREELADPAIANALVTPLCPAWAGAAA